MSLIAATQIPKPADEQAFERASVLLWANLLDDPNVPRNGRRGQRQNGVDLYGIRDGDSDHYVGIQCKLKSDGHTLSEKEVRDEVTKALTFKPALREYFIITTAPDDVAMQQLARTITGELRKAGTPMLVNIWGWNTLEEKISQDAEARNLFDPTYTPHSAVILEETRKVSSGQADMATKLANIETLLKEHFGTPPGDATTGADAVEAHLDAEIDNYRALIEKRQPQTAKTLLEGLLGRVASTASGRILFRIKANIGSCLYALGQDADAAATLAEAYEHAPHEPKAIANKAFSLLLQGHWRELQEFGVKSLLEDPTNEGLAGYLVQTGRFDDPGKDPLDLIPAALHNTAAVAIGRIDFYRWRRGAGQWWALAHQALADHPQDPHARQFAAEADIDSVVTDPTFGHSRRLTPDARGKLERAVTSLVALWDEARSGEAAIRPEDIAICGNIIVALHALDDFPRGIDIARQGLAVAPDDVDLLGRAAMVASEGGELDLTRELLPRLPEGPETIVIAFRLYTASDDWPALAALLPKVDLLPESEQPLLTAAARLADLLIGPREDRHAGFADVAQTVKDDARASIVVADLAREQGFADIADAAFEAAKGLVGPQSHFADRIMLARHAGQRDEWALAADLLSGHVDCSRDSAELRALARALVNDLPVRDRALKFFEALSPDVAGLPFYRHCEGMLAFNFGDLPRAETALRYALDLDPSLDSALALISVMRRTDRHDDIKAFLKNLDISEFRGSAHQRMHLAQALRDVGEPERAMALGYETVVSAPNDPRVALGYFGLVMMRSDEDVIPEAPVVALDTFVRLKGDKGREDAFLIVNGEDRPAQGIVSPSYPTAAAAFGLRVGDNFEMAGPFGATRHWRVAEIKHKYLHALHDVMQNFERRFPDADGFYSITMEGDDLEPALEQVRKASEAHRALADLYLAQKLPLAMVAQRHGGDSIGLVDYIRSLDESIVVCFGNHPERVEARKTIATRRAGGAVLDTYTAWTVATMDAFDVLTSVFGKLVVPRSVIDDLRSLADSHRPLGRSTMTVAYRDGQYFRQEHTAEDAARSHQLILAQIAKIEAVCETLPVAAPDDIGELAGTLTRAFASHILDPAFLARDGYVLVCEDMYYRQWASAATSAQGVWLQPVFTYALETDRIDRARYRQLIVGLAGRRHDHMSLSGQDLVDALIGDSTDELYEFAAVAQFIGGKNADLLSHVNVAKAFLLHIWSATAKVEGQKRERGTSLIVENLTRFTGSNRGLALALLTAGMSLPAKDCLKAWMAAKSIATGEIERARSRLLQRGVTPIAKKRAPPGFTPLALPNYGPAGRNGRPRRRKKRRG